jgi:hypothetical protein
MLSWSEALRNLLVGLERLEQAYKRLDHLERHLEDQDRRLRAVEIEVARLREAQATTRETVRAEITEVVAELRVRYAEQQAQSRPELPAPPEG